MKTSKRFSDREVDFSESDHNMVIVEFWPMGLWSNYLDRLTSLPDKVSPKSSDFRFWWVLISFDKFWYPPPEDYFVFCWPNSSYSWGHLWGPLHLSQCPRRGCLAWWQPPWTAWCACWGTLSGTWRSTPLTQSLWARWTNLEVEEMGPYWSHPLLDHHW